MLLTHSPWGGRHPLHLRERQVPRHTFTARERGEVSVLGYLLYAINSFQLRPGTHHVWSRADIARIQRLHRLQWQGFVALLAYNAAASKVVDLFSVALTALLPAPEVCVYFLRDSISIHSACRGLGCKTQACGQIRSTRSDRQVLPVVSVTLPLEIDARAEAVAARNNVGAVVRFEQIGAYLVFPDNAGVVHR